MIDTDFIVRYTNGLYTADKECIPRYDEFRDMFSSGQLYSKEWLVDVIKDTKILSNENVIIVGSWFGTLGFLIKKEFPDCNIKLLDLDPRCKNFIEKIIFDIDGITPITGDMFDYDYTENLIINTSCEHISNINSWINKIKDGTKVILQTNNFFDHPEHVNCVNSLDEFKEQVSLSEIIYTEELETCAYTRYMIVGIK